MDLYDRYAPCILHGYENMIGRCENFSGIYVHVVAVQYRPY